MALMEITPKEITLEINPTLTYLKKSCPGSTGDYTYFEQCNTNIHRQSSYRRPRPDE